ncbi:MAG: lipopolysaccharide kinase InaA family protein [Candidatus Binatia bacterium]
MTVASKYEIRRDGDWKLLVLSARWNPDLWRHIREILSSESPARHPQVKRFRFFQGDREEELYLKTYYFLDIPERMRSLFRTSKALRAFKQGEALQQEGFRAPLAVAAGEQRKHRLLQKAFLLTVAIDATPLAQFLKERFQSAHVGWCRERRIYLCQLAAEVARLHERGFVHGDLTPYNILVRTGSAGAAFFFLDNDRTRRYPFWLGHWQWKRNLVQLNRFQLPGIRLHDRIRFLRDYLTNRTGSRNDRRLIVWLEKRTRRRRAWKDRLRGELSFRELMKWDGRLSKKKRKVESWPA